MNLLEKANTIFDVLESDSILGHILDHITRLGMSDEAYVTAMIRDAQRKAARKVTRKWFGRALRSQAREVHPE